MARYIDADKLFPWLDVKYRSKYPIGDGEQYGTVLIYEVLDEVDDAETEDVAPVTHAHWTTTKLSTKWTFRCSNCNAFLYESTEGSDIQWKYCPDCGAKMDEVIE